MQIKKWVRWTASVCLLGMGTLAFANETYCSKPIRAAFFEYGLLFRSANGDGIDSRLLKKLQQETGCQFNLSVLPRKRIFAEMEAGSLDVATAAIPTPERRAYAFAIPYFQTRNLLLIRPEKAQGIGNLVALENSNLRIGVVRGFRHEPFYDALIGRMAASGRVVEAVDVIDNIRLLRRGVVDVILSQPVVYREYLDADELRQVAFKDWAPKDQNSPGALLLLRKTFTPEQAKNWDRLMVRWQKDGTLLKIYQQFFSPQEARAAVYAGPRLLD